MPANIEILINGKDMTGAAVSSAKNGLVGLGSSVDAVGGKFNAMTVAVGTVVGNLATGAISKLGELAGSIVTTGIGFDSMKQQADIAFTTMLGSGEKAKAFLDKLQAFAAKTPFEFPDLLMASQRMLAMGFQSDKVLPTLTAIGDAVAGLGGSSAMVDRVTTALGQMQAKGKATGEEMMQLTEAGIPAWDFLAQKIGVSIPEAMKMVTAGAVSADVAISALTDGMNTKFGGMMERQSATFAGLWSTIKDTFGQISGQVMTPLFDQMTVGLKMIVDWTNAPAFTAGVKALTGWMEKLAQIASDTFANMEAYDIPILTALYIAIGRMIPPELLPIWEGLRDIVSGVTRVVKSLFVEVKRYEDDEPMIGYLLDLGDRARETFKVMFDWSVKVIGKLWDWAERVMPPLVAGLAGFFDHMGMIVKAVQAVFGPVGSAIAKFINFDDVMTGLGILLAGPVIAAIGGVIASLATFLAPIAAVVAAVAALRWAWENDIGQIRTFTMNALGKLSDWFFKESGLWKGNWQDTWDNIINLADRLIRIELYNLIVGTWAEIKFQIQFHSTIIRDRVVDWAIKMRDAIEGFSRDAIQTFRIYRDIVISTWKEWTDPTIKGIVDWVSRTKSHIDTWVTYYVDKFTAWKDDMLELFQPVFDWWTDHVQPWIDYGADIIEGLLGGMQTAWKKFTDWTGTTFQGWINWFDTLFDFGSPSRLMRQRGQWLMEGLGNGIEAYASVPKTMLESTVNSMTAQLDRLKGAVVQNVFDINNAVRQLNLNPLTMPTGLGGTGTSVGLIGGSAGGTLLMGGGINNLPTHTTPTVNGTGSGSGANFVPTETEIRTLGEALGVIRQITPTIASSVSLLGGLTLNQQDLDPQGTKVKSVIGQTVTSAFDSLRTLFSGTDAMNALSGQSGPVFDSISRMLTRVSSIMQTVGTATSSLTDVGTFQENMNTFARGISNVLSGSRADSALAGNTTIQDWLTDLVAKADRAITSALTAGMDALKVKDPLGDFIAGMGDFLESTLEGANQVFGYFKMKEEHAFADGTLQEYVGSEAARTKTQLKGIFQGLQNSVADILGISTDELNVTGANSPRLLDRVSQLLSGTDADTNMESISKLLQSAVDFRNLSNYGTGATYFQDVLPTDTRLTGGQQTTNTFNITLAGSSNASADVMGMVQLLSSLTGTASP